MANILSLPLEIRQMIYSYILIVGSLMPYQRSHELALGDDAWLHSIKPLPSPPITALLETCRTIYTEASPILYSKNKFYLPITELTAKFFAQALHNSTRCSWVKSVHLELLPQDMFQPYCPACEDHITATLDDAEQCVLDEETFEEDESSHCDELHYLGEAYKQHLRLVSWPQKVELVIENLALDYLSVDLVDPNCCCGDHICQMAASALSPFSMGFAHGMPTYLKIYGSDIIDGRRAKRAMRHWTEQRKQGSIPLIQGLNENWWLVHRVESEGRLPAVVVADIRSNLYLQ